MIYRIKFDYVYMNIDNTKASRPNNVIYSNAQIIDIPKLVTEYIVMNFSKKPGQQYILETNITEIKALKGDIAIPNKKGEN